MNSLTAYLLLYCSEQNVFIILTRLMRCKKYCLTELYKEGMPQIDVLKKQFNKMLKKNEPKLYNYFKNIDYDVVSFVFIKQWLTLFTQSGILTLEELKKFWSLFFLDGWEAVLKLSYLILIKHKEEILLIEESILSEYFSVYILISIRIYLMV